MKDERDRDARRLPVIRVGREHDVLAAIPFLNLERAAGDRGRLQGGGIGFGLRTGEDFRRAKRQLAEEVRRGLVDRDLNSAIVHGDCSGQLGCRSVGHGGRAGDVRQVKRPGPAARVRIKGVRQRPHHVGGCDRGAVREGSAFAQREGVGQTIFRSGPAFREVGDHLQVPVEAHEAAVQQPDHGEALRVAGFRRIERDEIVDAFQRPAQGWDSARRPGPASLRGSGPSIGRTEVTNDWFSWVSLMNTPEESADQ